ncbi:MAG: TetR/AcrR family transcriptional regulator [Gammaproteobacteria bacterium]
MAGRKRKTAGRRPRRGLTREQIIDTAVLIANETGLESISFRQIATRLGVTPMACYHHVANKDELVDLVVARTLERELKPPRITPDTPWQTVFRGAVKRLHEVMDSHPMVLEAIVRSPFHPNSMEISQRIFDAFDRAGLSPEQSRTLFDLTLSYLCGAVVARHLLRRHQPRRKLDEYTPETVALFRRLYPHRALRGAAASVDMAAEQAANFDVTIDLIVHLATHLAARHPPN